ncbi:MAG: acyltransferase [Actinobacteria bacterium]|nr:acyltransferase [Actinomycetota bacterium]
MAVVVGATGHGAIPAGAAVGLEIFFVLSGYLTVRLLVAHEQVSLAHVARFVGRRARRVLPALLTMLGGVSLLVLTARPDVLERLGPDIRATLVGAGNWHLVRYTSASAPSFLEHLWALAVGAQLTLVVAVVLLVVRSRRGRAVLRLAGLVLAVGSAVALAMLSMTAAVPERALYGTDTRAAGMLLGVVLGLSLRPPLEGGLPPPRARRLQVLGLVAFVGLLAAMTFGGGALVWLTRGGLLVVDVLAVIVIAVIVRGARLDGMLGAVGLRWIGVRSYALYLWHWPVLLALGGPATVRQPVVTAVYVVAVVVLADLTYRFVEIPLGGARHVPSNGTIGAPAIAVRTTAIACGSASAAALLTGPPQA